MFDFRGDYVLLVNIFFIRLLNPVIIISVQYIYIYTYIYVYIYIYICLYNSLMANMSSYITSIFNHNIIQFKNYSHV